MSFTSFIPVDPHIVAAAGWIVTVVAVAGVLLNNARRRACFCLWIFSNALSAAIHLVGCGRPLWSLAARDGIFLILAIAGWVQWRKDR